MMTRTKMDAPGDWAPDAPGMPAAAIAKPPSLGKLKREAIAPRVVICGVEGWGKTSMAAFAPEPAILCAAGESGYKTLHDARRVPTVLSADCDTWEGTLALVRQLANDPQGIKTVALDALGGFERMMHEQVCARDYQGDWGEHGFLGYQRGFERAVTDWLMLQDALDTLRTRHGVTVVILSHAAVRTHKNPLGADFDRYVLDCHPRTSAVLVRWVDVILFATFETVTMKQRGETKAKGIGGTKRVAYTTQCDAYTAKNRYGMVPRLDIPDNPRHAWGVVWDAIMAQVNATESAEKP